MKRALWLAVFWLVVLSWSAPLRAQGAQKPPRTVSEAQYRSLLEASRERLVTLERRAPRDLRPVLRNLQQNLVVRRRDGATQSAPGTHWEKWNQGFERSSVNLQAATRDDARHLRRTIETHLQELNAWTTRDADGTYFQAADARKIVRQLEGSGQIRTGPTWWQSAVDDVRAWWSRTLEAFTKWLQGLFPTRTGPANTPDAAWLWPVFWAIVAALLGFLVFLLFRALAGTGRFRWRQKRGASEDRPLSPEDAELMLLPPDELRLRARRFAGEGLFREALRHRFIAVLLDFDMKNLWRYDVRRTNWEHIEALRRSAQGSGEATREALAPPLGDLTRRFDRVRYGEAPCSEDDWRRFERDASALEDAAARATTTSVRAVESTFENVAEKARTGR